MKSARKRVEQPPRPLQSKCWSHGNKRRADRFDAWSADPCPHDNRPPFPGVHGFIHGLTGGRASIRAVQRWTAGSRAAPTWFVAILRDSLLARRDVIDEALKELNEYRGGPGHGKGLRDYWRDKRNRKIEEARKARPAP
jgi:hypothetical protein